MWIWVVLFLFACVAGAVLWAVKVLLSPSLSRPLQIRPEGKAVLITGAASGIGRHAAETLVKNGCFVYACDNNQELLHSVFDNVEGVKPITMDVTKLEDIQNVKKIVDGEGRGLFGLVNCAGIVDIEGHTHGIVEIPEEQAQRVMDTNFMGMTRMCRTFFPLLVESRGSIVNIASVAGIMAVYHSGYYSPSKFAMIAYSNMLRGECKAIGLPVRVCCIEPGFVNTPLLEFDSHLKWDRTSRWHDHLVARYAAREEKIRQLTMKTPEKVTRAIMCGLFCDPAPPHILVDHPFRVIFYKLASKFVSDEQMDTLAR